MNPAQPRSGRWWLARAAAIVAGALCASVCQADDEPGEDTRTAPPWYPHLEPAPRLTELETSEFLENLLLQHTVRVARILFPELAEGEIPTTDFGMIAWAWEGDAVLFRESEGETFVEKRGMKRDGVRLDDMAPDEAPDIVTVSRALQPDIATASVSAIRRALTNARPHRPGNVIKLDGVQYYFFSGDGIGKAHSPDPDTEAGSLVQLARVLGEFADGQAEERDLRVALENALRANHGLKKER
ncbi:MAG: hypothetical protein OXP28_09080 [Gammaproteobacteria bacterium]|nr:hypothetical protein [Gammaproteobacteria bacterium]